MTFANPFILWALPLGLIPVAIYYLLRFRSLRVEWGANYVLQRALDRLKKRFHLDQLILLAIRTIACTLIILAFARPLTSSRSASVSGSGVHHVIVLDASYSMLAAAAPLTSDTTTPLPSGRASPPSSSTTADSARPTKWHNALATMRRLIPTWGRGETWSFLVLGSKPVWLVDGATIQSPDEALAQLDRLRPEEATASLAAGLEEVARKFPRGGIELFLFADDQAITWEHADRASPIATTTGRAFWIAPRPSTSSPGNAPNLAVTAITPACERVLVGAPNRVAVKVRNFSTQRVDDARIELFIDDTPADRRTASLLPGQEMAIEFEIRIDKPGSHYLLARVPDDALDFDNRMYAGVEARSEFTIAVLRDADQTGKFASAWSFIDAYNRSRRTPNPDGQPSGNTAAQDIRWSLESAEPDAATLRKYDAVILDGGKRVTPALAQALRDYVNAGGGVILAADASVDAAAWNTHLAAAGLLPAPLGSLRTELLGGDSFRSITLADTAPSALRLFESPVYGNLAHARLYAWFDLGQSPPASQTLLRLDDRSPWALRGSHAPGRVVLLASGLTGRGDNLVVREFFVPLLRQLAQESAAGRGLALSVPRGRRPAVFLRDPDAVKSVTFASQDAEPVNVTPRRTGDHAVAEADDDAPQSGLYSFLQLRDGESSRTFVAVRGERVDSDLAPLSDAAKNAIVERLSLDETPDWPSLDEALRRSRTGAEWQPWVIAVAIALLLGEQLFQKRFSPQPIRTPRRRPAASIAPKPATAGAAGRGESTQVAGSPAPQTPARV